LPAPTSYFSRSENRKAGSGFASQNYERQPKDQYNWSKADTSNRRTVDPSFPRQRPIFRGAKYINASSRLAPQKATDNPKTRTSGRKPSRRTIELTSARAPYPKPSTNHHRA